MSPLTAAPDLELRPRWRRVLYLINLIHPGAEVTFVSDLSSPDELYAGPPDPQLLRRLLQLYLGIDCTIEPALFLWQATDRIAEQCPHWCPAIPAMISRLAWPLDTTNWYPTTVHPTSPACYARLRGLRYLLNVIEPDRVRQPLRVSDQTKLADLLANNADFDRIMQAFETRAGGANAVLTPDMHLTPQMPLWSVVDVLREHATNYLDI